ncbi:MAG TPA: hypothetical protein VFE96_00235 [Candidatus Bathyarchaeia archaeon]|jgi:hypothetical protein|nr:hypothetical protein [Candidatus Bathyarchaeia archaeon]
MVLPLDYLLLIVITVLTITLLLTNYVAYLSRGRKHAAFYEAGALVFAGVATSVFLGSAMVDLGQQYGTDAILSRWGFTFGWAFMLTLGGACASIYERHHMGMISITFNIVATLLIGFALVAGLLFSSESLPPLPTSIVNLGLAALFTSFLKLMFEKKKDKGKKGLLRRFAGLFKR